MRSGPSQRGLPKMTDTASKGTRPSKATALMAPTVAAEGTSEGEGVGHVIGRHLFGHQCHQGTICHLEITETEGEQHRRLGRQRA